MSWTNSNTLGPTWGRTVVFPYEIRFDDETKWETDSNKVCEWFAQQFKEAANIDCKNILLPKEKAKPKVINLFYAAADCPVTITSLLSEWRDADKGIWCKAEFECPAIQGKSAMAVKFGLWCFNAFDELLFVGEAYATNGPFKSGQVQSAEWITKNEALGPTHYKSILYPTKVRFDDGSWWEVDKQVVYEWFRKQMEMGGDIKFEQLFPEKTEKSDEDKSKTPA